LRKPFRTYSTRTADADGQYRDCFKHAGLLFDNIQHLLVALMQGSFGHCPELVEVKFFFLVQLAEMSKLLTRRYRRAKAVRFDSLRGRLVGASARP
jgi:hypothetical protein